MQPPTTPITPPQQGDEEHLYRQHQQALLRAVTHVVNAPSELIEDACQMAWTTLLRNQPRRETTFAWLRRVAINEAYRLSAIDRRDARIEHLPPVAADDEALDNATRAREALRALAALPERQRRDMAMRVAGYSYKEIAALTGRTYTNVDKTLDKARAAIRLKQLRSAADRAGANNGAGPS